MKLLTTSQVADQLGVTRGRISHFVAEGRLKPVYSSTQGHLFSERSIVNFAAKPRPGGRKPKRAKAS